LGFLDAQRVAAAFFAIRYRCRGDSFAVRIWADATAAEFFGSFMLPQA
jgi:hypothetical protein